MQIIRTNLDFKNLSKRTTTRRIVIHHSASSDVAVHEIHKWHINRGFSGIGYHCIIRQDGSIEEGRPMETIGAHAGSEGNLDSIGICLTGNFENYSPDPKQIDSLVNLINYLKDYYQVEFKIVGHKDVTPTLCPGKLFPWSELEERLKPSINWQESLINESLENGLITEHHNPQDPAPKWFVLAVGLNLIKKLGGINNEN